MGLRQGVGPTLTSLSLARDSVASECIGTVGCAASTTLYGRQLRDGQASSVLLPLQGNRLQHWRGHHHPRKRRLFQEQRRRYWGKSFSWIRTNGHWTRYI